VSKDKYVEILKASLRAERREEFLRVEGSRDVMTVSGPGCSVPRKVKIQIDGEEEREVVSTENEADAVVRDLLEGKKESTIVPLEETGQDDEGYG
jgi:dihydrodiol dehydrogenase / D-xylose 1-dehydrogenase (NADP)